MQGVWRVQATARTARIPAVSTRSSLPAVASIASISATVSAAIAPAVIAASPSSLPAVASTALGTSSGPAWCATIAPAVHTASRVQQWHRARHTLRSLLSLVHEQRHFQLRTVQVQGMRRVQAAARTAHFPSSHAASRAASLQ